MFINKENEIKLHEFVIKYGSNYPKNALKFIVDNFGNDETAICDIMRQVYDYVGILPNKQNIYEPIIDIAEDMFGIDKDILEVGGGFYPNCAIRIKDRQLKINKGTITVYDTALVIKKIQHIRLVKSNFSEKTNISKYDYLFSIMACEATEAIVRNALKNDKDFILALCGCTHFKEPRFNVTYQSWENYIYDIASDLSSNNCILDIKRLSKNYDYPYGIITAKHKKNQ